MQKVYPTLEKAAMVESQPNGKYFPAVHIDAAPSRRTSRVSLLWTPTKRKEFMKLINFMRSRSKVQTTVDPANIDNRKTFPNSNKLVNLFGVKIIIILTQASLRASERSKM